MCRSKQSRSGDKETVHNVINYSTVFCFFLSFFLHFFLGDESASMSAFHLLSHLSPELTGTLEFINDFLLLYAPVLKPDCHLSLCQVSLRGYPSPFVLGDEFIGGVLPFQFFELHLGIWHTLLPPTADRAVSTSYSVCGGEGNAMSHLNLLHCKKHLFSVFNFCSFRRIVHSKYIFT